MNEHEELRADLERLIRAHNLCVRKLQAEIEELRARIEEMQRALAEAKAPQAAA